jgi:recombinational DNA repair protein RecT
MSKKTVIKRMCKYAPQSKEDKRLQQAIEWDSLAEVGKLQYDKGSLVAGSTVAEEAQQEQKIQLKAFAKPVEETKPTEEAKNNTRTCKRR